MALRNGDIFMAKDSLVKLMELKLPLLTSYRLAKLASKLNEPLRIIEAVRQAAIRKYGVKDANGQFRVEEGSEKFTAFVADFNALMDEEVEVVFEKVKLPLKVSFSCDKCGHSVDKPLEIEAAILMALDPFIEVS